jgi:hypothetical protein
VTEQGSFLIAAGAQVTNVTLPPEQLCHYLTDDELERLGEMRKEPVMEIFLCSVGAFLGALIPALQVLSQFAADSTKVGGWGLLTLLVAVAMLAVAVVSGVLWHQRSKTHKDMVTTVRERPRIPVRLAHDNTR